MREDCQKIVEFSEVIINNLEDVLSALPALIPQSEEDEKLFKEGMYSIQKIIHDLKNSESVRELSRYLDVDRIDKDFTYEDVKKLKKSIPQQSKDAINDLMDGIKYGINGD